MIGDSTVNSDLYFYSISSTINSWSIWSNQTPRTSTDLYGRALRNLSQDHDAAVLIGSHLLPLLVHLDQWQSCTMTEFQLNELSFNHDVTYLITSVRKMKYTMPNSVKYWLCSQHWAMKYKWRFKLDEINLSVCINQTDSAECTFNNLSWEITSKHMLINVHTLLCCGLKITKANENVTHIAKCPRSAPCQCWASWRGPGWPPSRLARIGRCPSGRWGTCHWPDSPWETKKKKQGCC